MDKSLQIYESSSPRFLKVAFYKELGDRVKALLELERILELYSNDEEVYLRARKEKDTLEAIPSPSIGNFLRSIFK